METTVRHKAHLLHNQIDVARPLKTGTFRTFDNLGTMPVHGFQYEDDYYTRASCRPFLRPIHIPVLNLQAADDALMRRGRTRARCHAGSELTWRTRGLCRRPVAGVIAVLGRSENHGLP